MAKTSMVVTKDDWTGEVVDTTDIAPEQITTFTFNGREYRLDLSTASAEELAATLAPWMVKASQVNVVGRRARRPRAATETAPESGLEDRGAVREWARENGFDIGPRGPIPDTVMRAYRRRDDPTPEQADNEETAIEPEAHSPAAAVDETPGADGSKPTAAERAAIRQWAQEQGIAVKNRGPLSPDLIRNYRSAHAA